MIERWCSSYSPSCGITLNNSFGTGNEGDFTEIAFMPRWSSIHSSTLSLSSSSSESLDLLDRPSGPECFRPATCLTVKANSLIHDVNRVTIAPGRSTIGRFSWWRSVLASISTVNLTPYSQTFSFLSAQSNARHSRSPASYFFSGSDQTPLSYRTGCLFPSLTCCNMAPQPFH